MIRLSHTAKELYLQNPRRYYFHYYLYLREKVAGSALFFGSIIESGLEVLFEGGTVDQAKQTFRKNFKSQQINNVWENLATSENVRFSKADYDPGVFTSNELKDLEPKSQQFKSWASLQRKGELLIEAYSKDIIPKIKKVVASQPQKIITNELGDEILVKADIICEWEDGRLLIPDHKTSSLSVKQVAQNEAYQKQTALYYAAFGDQYPLDGTGFIVLEKNIRKNEPRARVSFDFFKPKDELIQKVIDEFDFVFDNIKNCNFPYTAQEFDKYGQPCPFRKFYESGGKDMTGLVKVGKSK